MNCEYLRKLNFDSNIQFSKKEYDAKLWLREILLNSQANNSLPKNWTVYCISIAFAALPVILDKIFVKLDIEDAEKPAEYWFYNIAAFCFNSFFYFVNIGFLFISFSDANRRNSMMKKLS